MALSKNGKTAAAMVGVVVVMGALAWAAVPLYNIFCRVTGFAGTTSVAEVAPDVVLDRIVKVRFDGSLARGMPWTFKPVQLEMDLKIGETGLAFYEAHNPTDRVVTGRASYNVYPYYAGGFFTKIACFCFTEQTLQPGQSVKMPVTFYVDPEIVNDFDGKNLRELTLSYTFFEVPGGVASDATRADLTRTDTTPSNEL